MGMALYGYAQLSATMSYMLRAAGHYSWPAIYFLIYCLLLTFLTFMLVFKIAIRALGNKPQEQGITAAEKRRRKKARKAPRAIAELEQETVCQRPTLSSSPIYTSAEVFIRPPEVTSITVSSRIETDFRYAWFEDLPQELRDIIYTFAMTELPTQFDVLYREPLRRLTLCFVNKSIGLEAEIA
jgi:hypothetical protein